MYLSRIELDVNRRKTMKALTSPSIFHGAVESSFKGEKKRRLWRVDALRGKQYILILSEDTPELEEFSEQFGYPGRYEVKSYAGLIDRITEGTKWRFRLAASPTYTVRSGEYGKRGKVKAHRTEEHQREWLLKKAEQNGFALSNDDFSVNGAEFLEFRKKNSDGSKAVQMIAVTYEGILEVTDREKFKNALCDGIGREKAYGMGLLTVMRCGNG